MKKGAHQQVSAPLQIRGRAGPRAGSAPPGRPRGRPSGRSPARTARVRPGRPAGRPPAAPRRDRARSPGPCRPPSRRSSSTARPSSWWTWNSSGSPVGGSPAGSTSSRLPRRSSAASRSGASANRTSSRPECGRADSMVSEPAAAPSGSLRDEHGPRGEPLLGESVRTSTTSSPRRPCARTTTPTRSATAGRRTAGLSGRCRRHPPARPDRRCRSPPCAGRWPCVRRGR